MPGEAGYDEARQAWNLGVDQRPAVVVIAESADDVARAVGYAGKHEMRVAPQGTGHDAGALEPLDDAMLLRTSRMRGVRTEGKSPDVGREPHAQPRCGRRGPQGRAGRQGGPRRLACQPPRPAGQRRGVRDTPPAVARQAG